MVRVFEPFEMLKLAPWLADASGKITAAGNRTYGFCQSTTRAHERQRHASAGGLMRIPTRRARQFIGSLLYRSGTHRRFWKKRAAIVIFHRVDDRYVGDPITCSFAQFCAYCDFFQRYFIVVSLGELLDRLSSGQDISRHLVITFDDGYRDNARCAAELKRRGLPA